jgi:hypothetical protein
VNPADDERSKPPSGPPLPPRRPGQDTHVIRETAVGVLGALAWLLAGGLIAAVAVAIWLV